MYTALEWKTGKLKKSCTEKESRECSWSFIQSEAKRQPSIGHFGARYYTESRLDTSEFESQTRVEFLSRACGARLSVQEYLYHFICNTFDCECLLSVMGVNTFFLVMSPVYWQQLSTIIAGLEMNTGLHACIKKCLGDQFYVILYFWR